MLSNQQQNQLSDPEEVDDRKRKPTLSWEEKPKEDNYFRNIAPHMRRACFGFSRTYIERGLYDDAMRAFNEATIHPTASHRRYDEVPVTQAHMFPGAGDVRCSCSLPENRSITWRKKKEKAVTIISWARSTNSRTNMPWQSNRSDR